MIVYHPWYVAKAPPCQARLLLVKRLAIGSLATEETPTISLPFRMATSILASSIKNTTIHSKLRRPTIRPADSPSLPMQAQGEECNSKCNQARRNLQEETI
ncbi:hypothetical protein Pcinc_040122 [Petrolisthes cinctipes]|uniref:Uncharacterized protein n=1 Tax=Petrolisthes cinctipes TaxID=88211 RepID=A0AAE1EL51_PETCI|nr:hypothetical protein Pcinc_040122 [Petrolisthes cinctipes]